MTEKDFRTIRVAEGMVGDRMWGVKDEDDLPIVLVDYSEDDEEWMKEVAEERGISIEGLSYDEIWSTYASELEEAVKEWREEQSKIMTKYEYVEYRVLPKFTEMTGVEVPRSYIDEDKKGLIHIKPYEGYAGWYFDINDPENFWFENIDSYSYNFVDFDEIVELMEWVTEDIKDYEIEN